MPSTRYKENIWTIKYGLIVLNILLMMSAIRAIVNYQNILTSIDDIKDTVIDTQEHTDYINNFLAPYLQSEYAPYFFAHENNQIFVGEKIINIITISWDIQVISTGENAWMQTGNITTTDIVYDSNAPNKQRNRYLSDVRSSIRWWYESFL